MSLFDVNDLAQAAYAAYNDALGTTPLVLWDDLETLERAAWGVAIARVLDLLQHPEATP